MSRTPVLLALALVIVLTTAKLDQQAVSKFIQDEKLVSESATLEKFVELKEGKVLVVYKDKNTTYKYIFKEGSDGKIQKHYMEKFSHFDYFSQNTETKQISPEQFFLPIRMRLNSERPKFTNSFKSHIRPQLLGKHLLLDRADKKEFKQKSLADGHKLIVKAVNKLHSNSIEASDDDNKLNSLQALVRNFFQNKNQQPKVGSQGEPENGLLLGSEGELERVSLIGAEQFNEQPLDVGKKLISKVVEELPSDKKDNLSPSIREMMENMIAQSKLTLGESEKTPLLGSEGELERGNLIGAEQFNLDFQNDLVSKMVNELISNKKDRFSLSIRDIMENMIAQSKLTFEEPEKTPILGSEGELERGNLIGAEQFNEEPLELGKTLVSKVVDEIPSSKQNNLLPGIREIMENAIAESKLNEKKQQPKQEKLIGSEGEPERSIFLGSEGEPELILKAIIESIKKGPLKSNEQQVKLIDE